MSGSGWVLLAVLGFGAIIGAIILLIEGSDES